VSGVPAEPEYAEQAGFSAGSTDWFAALAATSKLTPKGRKLAHFIAVNPRYVAFAAASDVGERTGVNPATVVRLAQALGFSGWTEFQLHFRHRYLGTLLPADVLRTHADHGTASALRASLERDLENLQSALVTVDFGLAEQVAATIAGARKTVVVSSGSYAAVGEVFAHLATFMGYSVELESHGGPHLVARFASLRPGDCVFAISFWRLNKHVVRATQHATQSGISTVALVDSRFSPLAQAAGLSLVVPSESGSFFQSMTAALAVVYGLLARLRELGGEQIEQTIEDAQQLYGELDVLYT
jgi:DNA-binding MurR/RpiR family transcriptional regulator